MHAPQNMYTASGPNIFTFTCTWAHVCPLTLTCVIKGLQGTAVSLHGISLFSTLIRKETQNSSCELIHVGLETEPPALPLLFPASFSRSKTC